MVVQCLAAEANTIENTNLINKRSSLNNINQTLTEYM
jgi:hypothetical protein